MQSSVVRLLVKAGLFLCIMVMIDSGVGLALRRLYYRESSGMHYRTTYMVEKVRNEVLFFGSSRCNHHYKPDVIASELGMTVYNGGRDGNGIPYHYAVLKSVLQRYTPKLVVLDVTAGDFLESNNSFERLSSLLPYYKTHPEIRNVVNERSAFEKFKHVSLIYPYNSALLTAIAGNMSASGSQAQEMDGYVPLNGTWKERVVRARQPGADRIDARKEALYTAFIDDCRQRHVPLVVVVSPYLNASERDVTTMRARLIAQQKGVDFLDFSATAPFASTSAYFADPTHLNATGAQLYSVAVARELKRVTSKPVKS